MQNTVFASPVPSTIEIAAQTVVQNDTKAASKNKGSIKLGAKGKVVFTKLPATLTPMERLESMESATRNWEVNELAASNKRLYSIMTDAYTYYKTMKDDLTKAIRAKYAEDLKQFIKNRKYTFSATSHDMTRVVKCVFGADRRRVSAYSIALREALKQNVLAENLAAFIEQEGGVEQIRLGGTKPLSASVRAGKVKKEVVGAELGIFKFDARSVRVDADWKDKQVVIVATYLTTGEFQANAVIRHDGAVDAALAAYYSMQQAAARTVAKSEREVKNQLESDLKKAAAKQKTAARKNAPKSTKEEKQAKQKTKVLASQLHDKWAAANKAHADFLFEDMPA
jgi:hypothetical protein